jgi:hypothetical protein
VSVSNKNLHTGVEKPAKEAENDPWTGVIVREDDHSTDHRKDFSEGCIKSAAISFLVAIACSCCLM